MSELKAYKMVDEKYCTDCVCVIPSDVYIKSEADKVIAELKERLDTTEKLLYKALNGVSNGNKHMMSLARKNNHANYKRCLAMARWCDAEGCWFENQGEDIKASWFFKWEHKWLELAEKFKEAK